MATKRRRKKKSPLISKADAAYGRKYSKMEKKQKKFNDKRMKAWTTLTPVGKKTKWTY